VCALCDQEQETAQHLAAGCVFAREVWFRVLTPLDLGRIAPQLGTSLVDWWLKSRGQLGQEHRKRFRCSTNPRFLVPLEGT
jgi:hypothetical protein